MNNNKTDQNEIKKKRRSIVRTDRVKDFSSIERLLNNEEFMNRLLNGINEAYLGDKK
ncbi:hypothetical protein [Fictibacillus phosphorivorans]|uniref:hypothetical protein n=1 Tax=Fictibacillus phosphorivorans TaxID=1221500 RepID=UPI000A5F0D2C|nr:hypothetical protein [Fictibacillus phosphorivorans]